MKRKQTVMISLLVSLAVALLMLACGDDPLEQKTAHTVVKSSVQRAIPKVSGGALLKQVAGSNRFALELYHKLRTDGDDLFCSPYSATSALAMLYGGARGNTEKQMRQGLHFELVNKELHQVFNRLDLELSSRGKGAKAADGGAFRLRVANAMWGQQGHPFLASYLDLLALNYGAGIHTLDFTSDHEGARKLINAWVSKETEERIPELMTKGTVTPTTAMVLTNAIYFNAAWDSPFQPSLTRSATFHGSLKPTTVEMMYGSQQLAYHKGSGFQVVSLPYDGKELSMVLLVPDKGSFRSFQKSFDQVSMKAALAGMSSTKVELRMPKFQFKRKYRLDGALKALGMGAMFSGSDFSGIDGGAGLLQVSAVVHEAFIKVNEEGAEAAAATGISMDSGAAPMPSQVYLTVDRPFLFLIRDNATGVVLFVGHVEQPV